MTQRDRELDDMLRRALHVAAESVEPAGDGLERIRARLTPPRPLPVAWVMAGYAAVARHAAGLVASVSARLRSVPGAARGHAPAHARRNPWRLRPIAVLGMAAFVIVAGVIALTPVSQQAMQQTASIISALSGGQPSAPTVPGGSGDGGVNGHGGGLPPGAVSQPSTAPSTASQPHSSPTACNSAGCPSASAASSTACPSPAAAPTSTPSPSTTPSPAASGSAPSSSCPGAAASSPPAGASSSSPATTPTPTPTPTTPTPTPTPSTPTPSTSPGSSVANSAAPGEAGSQDPSAGQTP